MHPKTQVGALVGLMIVFGTLVPGISINRAEAATTTITSDTTWGNNKIYAGDIVNISQHATLTITGYVDLYGTINVNTGSVLNVAPGATLNLNSATINVYQDSNDQILGGVWVSGVVNVKGPQTDPFTGMRINSNAVLDVLSGGTVNTVNDGYLFVLAGGRVENVGTMNFNGGTLFMPGGDVEVNSGGHVNFNTQGYLYDDEGSGAINVNSGGIITVNSGGLIGAMNPLNVNSGGMLDIKSGGKLQVMRPGIEDPYPAFMTINSGAQVNVAGTLEVMNLGTLTVHGALNILAASGGLGGGVVDIKSQGKLLVASDGTIVLKNVLVLRTGGDLENQGSIKRDCTGIFTQESGSAFTGNQIQDVCGYPVTHMSDTTASVGFNIGRGGYTIVGEYISSKSALRFDKIDQINLRIRKFGLPVGNAVVGIFDSMGVLKKQFGTKDVSTLTTGFKGYTFKLSDGSLFSLASGDRIGIMYTGGGKGNYISVMIDTNSADPFDGAKSYEQQFKAGVWSGMSTYDMTMTLKQTHN